MTDQRSPIESALDVLVYLPVGVAVTAAEEIPKLTAKGRARVASQLGVARILGQFAVAQGRKELERRWKQAATQPTSPPGFAGGASVVGGAPSGTPAGPFTPGDCPPAPSAAPDSPGVAPAAPSAAGAAVPGDRPGSGGGGGEQEMGSPDAAAGAADGWRPAVEDLAIPGYDSLSASQVVQRLAGLSPDELAEVGAYEATHRARSTILTRVKQLQGS